MSKNIIISIAVYCTEDNHRLPYTIQTYNSLMKTINFKTTDIVFINNGSCDEASAFLDSIEGKGVHIIRNKENLGTAEAINLGWKMFENREFKLKMDDDCVIHEYGWADEMARILKMEPKIGVLGLKRKDLPNQPNDEGDPTQLVYLNHKLGYKWDYKNVIEISDDIIGTCIMIGSELFEKVGYLWQPANYAFDDTLYCKRSLISGFINAFYPWIEMDHIDSGGTSYTEWKRKIAGLYLSKIEGIIKEYKSGERDLYYSPFTD